MQSEYYLNNARFTLWLPKTMYDDLLAYSKIEGCPASYIIRKALKLYLYNYMQINKEQK